MVIRLSGLFEVLQQAPLLLLYSLVPLWTVFESCLRGIPCLLWVLFWIGAGLRFSIDDGICSVTLCHATVLHTT